MADADQMMNEIEALGDKLAQAKASINHRFIGQERVVELVLAALLSGGHGLLVGLPGDGKNPPGRDFGYRDGPQFQPHPVHARFDAGGIFWAPRCWIPPRMASAPSASSRARFSASF